MKRFAIAVPLIAFAVAAVSIPSGTAGSTNKKFTAASAPNPAPGGGVVNFTLTISNDPTSPNQLGSANVAPPFPMSATACSGATTDPSATCDPLPSGSSVSSSLLQLRNLGIAPGASRTFTWQGTTPCADPGNLKWVVYAKQSNEFNGPPGNNFSPYPLDVAQAVVTAAGPLATLAFLQQPTNRQFDQQPIAPPVTVRGTDLCGNPIAGASVGLTIDPATGTSGATLGGTIPASTDSSGIATFADLTVSDVGIDYRLVATSGSVSATSAPFDIVDQLVTCSSGSCPPTSSSKAATTTTVNASGTQNGDILSLSLLTGTSPPSGFCGADFAALGAESAFEVESTGTSTPSYEVTWRLDKSIVNAQPENGASHFDICLGSKRVTQTSCASAPADGFTIKGGSKAVCDPGSGLYWGLLPDKKGGGSCKAPAVLSRNKNQAGDVVITFCVPYPWDPRVFGG